MNDAVYLRRFRIFISSPGDVQYERQLLLNVIDRIPYEPGLRGKVALEAVAWDKPGGGTPMLAAMSPQEAIDLGLPKPSECDIVVVIFWSRMGTPLPPIYEKPNGSRYFSGTEWEYENALEFSKKTGKPIVVVYRRTEVPLVAFSDKDFEEKRIQWNRVQAFFASFRNQDGSISTGYNEYTSPADFERQVERDLRTLVYRLNESQLRLDQVTTKEDTVPLRWIGSPFPGLRPFRLADTPVFFGRGREIDDLVAKLLNPDQRFLAIVGASGTGKSSLVNAGLLPRLAENVIAGSKHWYVVRFSPAEIADGDVFESLATGLLRDLPSVKPHPAEYPRLKRELISELHTQISTLSELICAALAECPEWSQILIFVDQLEELFNQTNIQLATHFIAVLRHALQSGRVRVIVTLRADFYGRSLEYPDLAGLLKHGTYPLPHPSMSQLLEMITRPAALAGLEFETGLADRILEDIGHTPGSLPLVAYTLHELYRVCQPEMRLTHRAYESFGGVRGAIVTRAEKLSAEIGEPITRYLPDLFHELVEVDEQGNAMRKRANIILFQNNPAILQLIEVFTQARLFTQGSAKDTLATIEIAHEALLHNWPRLADWLEKSREDLRLLRQVRLAAAEWERSQRNPDFLWRGERSKTLQIMLDRLHPHLNSSERLFAVPETHWLLEEIKSQSPTHYRRASIGDRLAEISDVRPGVGVDQNGRPDIVWCSVQGGEVTLVDIRRGRVEHTLGTFPVAPFCIAKFPLTWVQYRAFLEDPNGYANPKWWNGLAIRQNKPGQQARPVANHPAENVSWYDAIAYCRWLSAQLGYEVRLPTEWEWQQSATGGNPDCLYPWGNHFNSIYANTYESGLGRSTAVGMYPHGASPVGALDMSGNIREWCLNGYETPEYTEVFAEDELAGQKTRALRGGSWRYDQVVALTSYRYGRYTPDTRNDNLGMRLATQALPIPEHGAK